MLFPFMWDSKFHAHTKYFKLYFNPSVLERRQEDKRFWAEWQQAFPEVTLFLMPSWMQFLFVTAVPKCSNCANFLKIC
jgi:hypothetical protein